jgi:hypothetical protein
MGTIFEVIGSISDYEREFRRNDAGGEEPYEYVPLLYLKNINTGSVKAYSLNGRFINNHDIPPIAEMPAQWCQNGKLCRLKLDIYSPWSKLNLEWVY